MRWLTWAIWTIAGLTLLVILGYGLAPGLMEWAAALMIGGAATYLAVVYRHPLATWRGFGAMTGGCLLVLGLLAVQDRLWPTASDGLHRLNVVLGFVGFGLLIGVFASSALLLIYRDASIAFLGAIWLLFPLLLLTVMARFGSTEALAQARLRETLVFGVPMLWMLVMLCLAPLAFAAHFLLLLKRELARG